MTIREKVQTESSWEQQLGYCRAIRVGNRIEISGTTAVVDGEIVGTGDAYQQTTTIMNIIRHAVEKLGGQVTDIVRIRVFVTDATYIPAIIKGAQEFGMREIEPVATLVVVKSLIDPRLLVEIEADAILEE